MQLTGEECLLLGVVIGAGLFYVVNKIPVARWRKEVRAIHDGKLYSTRHSRLLYLSPSDEMGSRECLWQTLQGGEYFFTRNGMLWPVDIEGVKRFLEMYLAQDTAKVTVLLKQLCDHDPQITIA